MRDQFISFPHLLLLHSVNVAPELLIGAPPVRVLDIQLVALEDGGAVLSKARDLHSK